MDPHRFDALARSLSTRGPRRATLAAAAGGLTSLLGFAGTDARKKGKGKKKKHKKPKPSCSGDLDGVPCGDTCCNPLGQKCCDGACIPTSSCCLSGGAVPNGGRYEQCGLCVNGQLSKDQAPCKALDPDGCTICSGYQCIPGNEGNVCNGAGGCGACSGGLCESTAGSTFCPDEGTGKCCIAPAICCFGVCCANTDGTSLCCNGKKLCYSTVLGCPPA